MKKQPIQDGKTDALIPQLKAYRGSDSKCSRRILELKYDRNENDPAYGDYPDDDLVLTFRFVRNKQ